MNSVSHPSGTISDSGTVRSVADLKVAAPVVCLTFDDLRAANTLRTPLFKNARGGLAHKVADGSDWSPAQWLQATFGELGEYAKLRASFERGEIGSIEYEAKAAKELADVQSYLDQLARRSLDHVEDLNPEVFSGVGAAQRLQDLIGYLGEYANLRKKLHRGDIDRSQFERLAAKEMNEAKRCFDLLMAGFFQDFPEASVVVASPGGVNLGQATIDKFDEVSRRVGVEIFLGAGGAAARKAEAMTSLLEREANDADELLRLLGLDVESMRTEGGSINMPKVRNALLERSAAVSAGEGA